MNHIVGVNNMVSLGTDHIADVRNMVLMAVGTNMTKTQLLMLAATVVTALVADYDAYRAAVKDDPNLRWDWWPCTKRLVLGLVTGLVGGAATEVAG